MRFPRGHMRGTTCHAGDIGEVGGGAFLDHQVYFSPYFHHTQPSPLHPHFKPRTPANSTRAFFLGVTCGEPCVIRRMLVRCGQGHLDTWRYNLFSFYHQHSHNLVFPFTPFEPHTPANPCVSHGVICGEPHGMQGISVRWREGHPWTTRCIFALFPSHSAIPPLPPFTPTSNLEHPPTRAFFPGSHAGDHMVHRGCR